MEAFSYQWTEIIITIRQCILGTPRSVFITLSLHNYDNIMSTVGSGDGDGVSRAKKPLFFSSKGQGHLQTFGFLLVRVLGHGWRVFFFQLHCTNVCSQWDGVLCTWSHASRSRSRLEVSVCNLATDERIPKLLRKNNWPSETVCLVFEQDL